jgi:pSer/pThr/pTyr-binding forkhead associated (FHA) protein
MICVLEIIDGPARGKRIWLKENQSLELGRVSTADFAVPSDSHMSRRHLLFEATIGGFRVRDVGSANGTFVNNRKVSVVELQTGDIVRAGMTVLSVSMRNNGENPHDRDGLSFTQSATIQSPNATVSEFVEKSGTVRSLEGLGKFDFDQTVRIPVTEEKPSASSTRSLPTKPCDPQPVAKESSALVTPTSALPHDCLGREIWWKNYFGPSSVVGVFEQTAIFDGPDGNLAGLALTFAKVLKTIAIVNQSQLTPAGVKFLQRLYDAGMVETVSWSLCFVKMDGYSLVTQLINHCEQQDAMVVLGSPFRLGLAELKPYANSLSYPSMFSQHVLDHDASLRKTLLKNDIFALFEPNRDWKTSLLING